MKEELEEKGLEERNVNDRNKWRRYIGLESVGDRGYRKEKGKDKERMGRLRESRVGREGIGGTECDR